MIDSELNLTRYHLYSTTSTTTQSAGYASGQPCRHAQPALKCAAMLAKRLRLGVTGAYCINYC
jgi:hypothetical protein